MKANVEKIGDHQLEDLAKYSYKTEIKQKFKIIRLYVWLHNENQIYKYDEDDGWMDGWMDDDDDDDYYYY